MGALKVLSTLQFVLAMFFIIAAPLQQNVTNGYWYFSNAAIFLALAAITWNVDLAEKIADMEWRIELLEGEKYDVVEEV